ncbi:hypothetical protein M8Z33_23650 [Streptomyces sp. ZAF1911]|uniref:hypothetical protein n=1 Tax=Streptomyces sp. ZAF1911 TaxID=2944129 RepID=UPI00237AE7FB|nr:hypothetical protein [Streptomyces sp. ZAF1911]MDD9379595.1 hypothetical protein [Streptomyces sp. ZAF1911]
MDEDNRFIVFTGMQDVSVPGPTPVRVEVRRAGSDKVVAVVDRLDFYFDDGGTSELGDDYRWYQGDGRPLTLDEMGDYELDMYAKDRDGKELGRRNAGRFTYALDARIEAGSSRTEFSLDDLDTRVTGSVTAVHPRRNVRLPLAGANARARLGNGTADVVSDAQGRFATSVAALGNETRLGLSVELASGDTETPGEVPVRTKTQQAVLTLSTPGPLTARYGSSVVLRGTLGRLRPTARSSPWRAATCPSKRTRRAPGPHRSPQAPTAASRTHPRSSEPAPGT